MCISRYKYGMYDSMMYYIACYKYIYIYTYISIFIYIYRLMCISIYKYGMYDSMMYYIVSYIYIHIIYIYTYVHQPLDLGSRQSHPQTQLGRRPVGLLLSMDSSKRCGPRFPLDH